MSIANVDDTQRQQMKEKVLLKFVANNSLRNAAFRWTLEDVPEHNARTASEPHVFFVPLATSLFRNIA